MKQRLAIRLDSHDPRYQEWRVGELPPFRLSAQQAREALAIASKLLAEQDRHVAGAKIVLPVKVERLA